VLLAVVLPTFVNKDPEPCSQMSFLFVQVSNVVPLIAVKGAVGGVNADVYTAVPFTYRASAI